MMMVDIESDGWLIVNEWMIIDCCVTKGANLCQQVIVISEGF